jgi:hypothetical protein
MLLSAKVCDFLSHYITTRTKVKPISRDGGGGPAGAMVPQFREKKKTEEGERLGPRSPPTPLPIFFLTKDRSSFKVRSHPIGSQDQNVIAHKDAQIMSATCKDGFFKSGNSA